MTTATPSVDQYWLIHFPLSFLLRLLSIHLVQYLAPEIILAVGHDESVDWWSLGVLLFELLTGRTPFADPSQDQLFENIVAGEIR